MKGARTGSGSFLQPRRLSFQDNPDQNLQIAPPQTNNLFSSPPQQEGHFLSLSRGAVSTPSDLPLIPAVIVQNAHGVATSPSFLPWQNGNFNMNCPVPICQPTQVRSPQNTLEAVKDSLSLEGYNGNKCVKTGAGGSGPSDRQALVKLMMDGYELPEMLCPCGSGPCIVLTSRTTKNPNRRFYKCPKCKFFKWCDQLGQSSQSPLKRTQGCTRSPEKITNPQNTTSEPDKPLCFCRAGPCIVRTMHEGENKGRKYYACPIKKGQGACKHFEWVDNPVKPPETENNSNVNQNNLLNADVTTPEPKQTFSTSEWVDNPVEPLETENNSNGNQNSLPIADVTTPEPKQRRTLSPYESVKDLFGENDMKTIEYWCKDQNDPNSTAAIEYERNKELSPGKRPHPPNTIGEISPMKRLNITDEIPVVKNCQMCGGIGRCIKCPILTCFKNDGFSENKHENSMDGGGISNLANTSPIGGTVVQNATPGSSKRSGKCFNCGREGHWSSECPSPRGTNSPCFKCGKLGHWMKNCNT